MDFEDLGEVWRRQGNEPPARTPAQELDSARTRAAELARTVRRRDWIETGVALGLLPFFFWVTVTTPHRLSAVGAAILVAACVFIPIRLKLARRRAPDPSQPVALVLRAELARIHAQEHLLGSVTWWYVAPLGSGAIILVAGAPVPAGFKVAYAVVAVAFCAWLIHLNRRAVQRHLRPMAHELESWLASLNDAPIDGVSDDT